MQSLRDQLLKAGLVTQEQASKAAADANRPRRKKRRNRSRKPEGSPLSKNAAAGTARVVELSESSRLELFQAIERHRVRGETRGEMEHYFTLRDGRVRKMFVSKEISGGLQSGRLAIVENGEQERHIIVSSEAVPSIADIDPDAVRFHNAH